MSVLATRGGNVVLVDDGDGMGHVESGGGRGPSMPVDSILKWGYWKPVGVVTAALEPIPGEEPFVEAYKRVLRRIARDAARAYRRGGALVAADQADDQGASLEEMFKNEVIDALVEKALKKLREQLALEAATAQAIQFGISFATRTPYLEELIARHAGKQAERIVAGSRDAAARVIFQARDEGWSVPQTASALQAKLNDLAKWQATMLARTDIVGLNNAGSYAAALSLGEARPAYKRWINADDEKVRPTHVAAMNQVQPIDQPFQVGDDSLMFPGDPAGSDAEVINCRCTLVYGDEPDAWTDPLWEKSAIFAAGWDESEHPREPDGTSVGGRFAKKTGAAYNPESAKGAGRFVASRTTERIARQMEQAREKLKATPPPVRTRPDVAGLSETVYVEDGGFSFNIYDFGDGPVYGWSGGPGDGHKTGFATADEAIDDALATLELEQELMEGKWSKRLRGMVTTRKDNPALHDFLDQAHEANNSNPEWRALAEEWDVGDDEVVLNEQGMASFGKTDASGFYDPALATVFLGGNEIAWKMEAGATGTLKSGMFSAGTSLSGLVRHEHGHAVWAKMTDAQLDEFRAMVPEKETRKQLSSYAAIAEEFYAGTAFEGTSKIHADWRGEVMSEAIAVTFAPEYRREDWPEWVNQMGDWVKSQKRQK